MDEWIISVVALRWHLPIHIVSSWNVKDVKRHFRAYKYEIEKVKAEKADEE